ncbi:MAG TPA: AgmX/PglI C-terminal domain-containing protein [Polyangia bacterium]|nr:AgmX/PglI C-terminal domain-containing protein [Polyangia bacterium]
MYAAGGSAGASFLALLALAAAGVDAGRAATPSTADAEGDSVGLGTRGTTCSCPSSESSNGAGEGRGIGGLGPPHDEPAEVWFDAIEVRGWLDREIVRRIAQRHRPELLACYEPVVARRRRLFGKLTIEFTIVRSGGVGTVTARRSTVRDPTVAGCFVAAIRNWQFPHLETDQAVVSQRFILVPPHRSNTSWKGGKRSQGPK